MNRHEPLKRSCALLLSCLALLINASAQTPATTDPPKPIAVTKTSPAPGTPADAVRRFYGAMREKRFREAFALSVFGPAVEGLTAEEYEDLRPDFERQAGVVLAEVVIGGEQVSGETATVFGKFTEEDLNESPKPVTLIRDGGAWIVGDRATYDDVKRKGKQYFFEARIETHHSEVEQVLRRVAAVQLAYSAKYGGTFGDLSALVREGFLRDDVLTSDSTGYRIYVKLEKGGKAYTAGAEPVRYGRTGRLSFFMDTKGNIKSKDAGGKPFKG